MTVGLVSLDSRQGRLVVVTTVLGSAVAMLTSTVVNVALPTLAEDLDATAAQQQWAVNSYLLAIASLILIGGSLGDRFGRVRIYRIGIVGFGATSLMCAVAPTIELLILSRFLQGIAGALVTPGSLAIIEATLRPSDRGRGIGRWSGFTGLAAAIGPITGGLLVAYSWRWVFLINLPVAVAVLALSRQLPESRDPEAQDGPIDLVGAVLTVLCLGGASYALVEGPGRGLGWLEMGAVLMALASLIGLIQYEPKREHAMLPVDLFGNRRFVATNLITLLVYGGMGLVFFLLSIQLQVTSGFAPWKAGAAFLPVTVIMALFSGRAGEFSQRVGARRPLILGPLLIACGMLLYIRIGPEARYLTDVLPAVLVFAAGLALSVAPVTAAALGSVPSTRAGAASGANNAIARTGQLLTVAAVPTLIGIGDDGLRQADLLNEAFPKAMIVGASLVALGALTAALMLPGGAASDTGH